MPLLLSIMLTTKTQAQMKKENQKEEELKINILKLKQINKTLRIDYEIVNNSKQELWICDSIDIYGSIDFEVYLAEDGKTLLIRKVLNVPTQTRWSEPPYGKYVRLVSGKKRTESLLIPIPVFGCTIFESINTSKNLINTTRMTIEIGYYEGNLPEMIFRKLEEAAKTLDINKDFSMIDMYGAVLNFNYNCERLRQRDEEIVIPYSYQKTKSEKILRTTLDDLRIPYGGRKVYSDEEIEEVDKVFFSPQSVLDLTSCTKLEILYEPSMLDFFFPFDGQQSFISDEEIKFLQSQKTIIIENPKDINAFSQEIIKEEPDASIYSIPVRQRSMAQIACYREDELFMTLLITNNHFPILIKEGQFRLIYKRGLQSIKEFTPQIRQLDLRFECAAHMKNLWYRLRLYNKRLKNSSNKDDIKYPANDGWCDAIVKPHGIDKNFYQRFDKLPHVTSETNELKSYYAMNPNCQPNSPGDMVLLFETKAGWNQHGGLELFTFDNHDPRGGCVLLNDGTVKFIQTEEELNNLRWE